MECSKKPNDEVNFGIILILYDKMARVVDLEYVTFTYYYRFLKLCHVPLVDLKLCNALHVMVIRIICSNMTVPLV